MNNGGLASPRTQTDVAQQTADYAVERLRALEVRVGQLAIEMSAQMSVVRSQIQSVGDAVDDLAGKVETQDKQSVDTLTRIEAVLKTLLAKTESGGPVPWSTPK